MSADIDSIKQIFSTVVKPKPKICILIREHVGEKLFFVLYYHIEKLKLFCFFNLEIFGGKAKDSEIGREWQSKVGKVNARGNFSR